MIAFIPFVVFDGTSSQLPNIPLQLSRNTCLREREKISSLGQLIITTRENLFQSISIPESSRIG